MHCQRCGDEARVTPHTVDGYTGLLCRDCYRAWERRLGNHAGSGTA